MRVPVLCPRGGLVYVRCMLERADRTAQGCVDPTPYVVRRSERAGGIRPPHPAELAGGLPMTETGGRWATLKNTIQFADPLQRKSPDRGRLVT